MRGIMNLVNTAVALLIFASLSIAQVATGLNGSNANDRLNQQFLLERRGQAKANGDKQVVVSPGDRVIAQFVDGGSWKTSMYFVNLENHSVSFQVLFFRDDGGDMVVPIVGQGSVRGLTV